MQLEQVLLGVIVVVQALALWQGFTLRRSVLSLEARLGRQADALTLLTETSESGFALVARELERGATPGKPVRKTATRRMTTAARKGRSIAEIAAQEGLSESEVHLRLHLASQAAAAVAGS